MSDPSAHALRVLEFERIREILASYAVSALGRKHALALAPSPSIEEARRGLEETREVRALLAQSRLPLAGARDVLADLDGALRGGGPADGAMLVRVIELLQSASAVKETLTRNPSALPRLAEIGGRLEALPDLREELASKIDARSGLKDGASPRLALLRKRIFALRESLRSKAQRVLSLSKLRPAFQSEGLTVKLDRFLLPVKAEYRSWVHGPIRDRSQTGSTLYIEPEELTLEGDELLDAIDGERGEVERILWELTKRVTAERATLASIQDILGRVDFTQAKAGWADAFGLISPEIVPDGALDLKDLRHPYLLWLARDVDRGLRDVDRAGVLAKVVPLSVRLGEGVRILVVTGPNTGGKTVALKTVGLNVLLASSGVPISAAEGSCLPWFDRVFADIGDEQSIEQSLSTFSGHLAQTSEILRHADGRSLILLDELGSGTDPLEGAALARALLRHFLERGWRAIITTHIGSLKELAYLHEGVENAAMEFDPKTLMPTYRMFVGIPGNSNALAIARRMGLDGAIVDAAEEEVSRVAAPTREIIARMERSRRRAEKERRRAERARRRAQGDAKASEEVLRGLEAERASLTREAQRIVDDSIRGVRERLEPLVAQLENVPKTHREYVDKLGEEVRTLLVGTPLGEKREAFARSLKKDERVWIPKFRSEAKVRKVDKAGRTLTVLLNGIPTEVSFDDVSWLEKPPESGGSI